MANPAALVKESVFAKASPLEAGRDDTTLDQAPTL
jgi:hypothetical protein